MADALALLELDSVASGLAAVDTLVKRAPVEVLEANLIEPGRFLVLLAGGVAEVEESVSAVVESHADALQAQMLLPFVHPGLLAGLHGLERCQSPEAIGIVEGKDVAGTIYAADSSLKNADVVLAGIRLAIGLGGRAYYVVTGSQNDVEAAIEVGQGVLEGLGTLHRVEQINRPHDEMVPWLLRRPPFHLGG
jgi:microcompartment protein CcmL/EutN